MKITKPTLILDKNKCLRNIEKMFNKAKKNKLVFRPHFKTHQSAIIGNWFRDFGISCITVSSVVMAKYFADNGWNDITIAFPLNCLEINEINELAGKSKLNVVLDNKQSAQFLVNKANAEFGVFIKIDCGYGRAGIPAGDLNSIDKVINTINKSLNLTFKGFLSHFGNTYNAASTVEIIGIYNDSIQKLKILKDEFREFSPLISIGDTPSLSTIESIDNVDEIRPGNFVFYDLMQFYLGSCIFDEIALIMACPVISKYQNRNEILIYGGAVHLSNDHLFVGNQKIYGIPVIFDKNQWYHQFENAYVKNLWQEHGIIKSDNENFNRLIKENLIGIVPVHSCLAAAQMREYLTTYNQSVKMMC